MKDGTAGVVVAVAFAGSGAALAAGAKAAVSSQRLQRNRKATFTEHAGKVTMKVSLKD